MANGATIASGPEHTAVAADGNPRPPTVLQVVHSLETGGVERSCVDVALATMRAGAMAVVASAGGPLQADLRRAGVEHVPLPLDSRNPLMMRVTVERLCDLMRRRGVDLVHARSRTAGWAAWRACEQLGVPFVTTIHAAYDLENPITRRFSAVMLRGARIIVTSDFLARYVREAYPVDMGRLRVIPRGIDAGRFTPARVGAERLVRLARDWRLPDEGRLVLAPARLSRAAGLDVLLDALARLDSGDLHCRIVGAEEGRSSYRRELERRVERLGLGDRVRIGDHCGDMPAAYVLAHVVVVPSVRPEGFGRVLIEALAMGRPVIASDLGPLPEVVRPSGAGWLVPPGDAAALAGALTAALSLDEVARAEIVRRAVDHVAAHYGVDRMTAATLAVYDEVLRETGRPGRRVMPV